MEPPVLELTGGCYRFSLVVSISIRFQNLELSLCEREKNEEETMNISTPPSRIRFASSSLSRVLSFSPHASRISPSSSCSQFSVSFVNQKYQSRSFSSAIRLLRCSSTSWSHWRPPVSLRAQSRITSPVIEKFKRKMATVGILLYFPL